MLKTFLTSHWGLRYPILNAPMTPAAGGAMARVVTDAGGLGMIGIHVSDTIEEIEAEVLIAREGDAARRFGFGFQLWALEKRPDQLEAALAAKPFCIAISFGDIGPYVGAIQAAGIKVATQVQDKEGALRAEAAGVDLIVAQGSDAGGHTGEVGTLPLLQIVLDAVTTPVIAAGGIGSGRGLAAVLAAGAEGAWIGTPFLMSPEARVPEALQAVLAASKETDTVLTSVFDRVQQLPWPEQYRGRALTNSFTERWHGREDEAVADPAAAEELRLAKAEKRYEIAHIYAGQIVGLLNRSESAAEIVRTISHGAETLLLARLGSIVAKQVG